MQCLACKEKAVFSHPAFCKKHLIESVERRVEKTIRDYNLCTKEDRICVAASGGKDSLALLAIMKKLGYKIEALAIDEGIAGYREKTLNDLKAFCKERSISLHIKSFAQETGLTLDQMVKDRHPCSVCGVFRRTLLNKGAQGYDLIATGHNLDDEAQAVLMNLAKANTALLSRTALKSKKARGFTPRIKPLGLITERETLAYTLLCGIKASSAECPYASQSFRAVVRDELNAQEHLTPGLKLSLIQGGLAVGGIPSGGTSCTRCGEPSARSICKACSLKEDLKGVV